MVKFVNREPELAALRRACGDGGGLAVVSGRRRVGKTALLDRFAQWWREERGRSVVFLPGTRAAVGEALRRLEDRVRASGLPVAGDLLDLGHFDTWDAALGYLLARTAEQPMLLVLDEFPYLCEADPALPSTLQARWDHRAGSQLSIVLAGSHVALMEELTAADAPLFGRADAHLRVAPFAWRDAGLLVGGDDRAGWLEAYVTVGGMPRYLSLWDPRHDALANVVDLLDGPGAPLGDEGTVVLQELSAGSAPARVLELIALGATSFTELRERAGLAPATTSDALTTLEGLGLVDRLTPVGEDPRRTKRVRYRVRDALLRLWLSVVVPHREAFELGRGAAIVSNDRHRIAASQSVGLKQLVGDWLAERTGAACGPWWPTGGDGGDGELDALALRGTTPVAAAAALWATRVDGGAERERLRTALAGSPYGRADELVVVARGGKGVLTAADLYEESSTRNPELGLDSP